MSVLTQKVLKLNRNWTPVGFTTVYKAIGLLASTYKSGEPKARIIDASQDFKVFTWDDWSKLLVREGERGIQGGTTKYRIPETILLSRFSKLPNSQARFNRRTLYRRDKNTCQYCGVKPGTRELSLDHILPRSRGGLTTWENCIVACTICNRCKADILPKRIGNEYTVYFANKGRKWTVTIPVPKKPHHTLYAGGYRCDSWQNFLGVAYWECELENDN